MISSKNQRSSLFYGQWLEVLELRDGQGPKQIIVEIFFFKVFGVNILMTLSE